MYSDKWMHDTSLYVTNAVEINSTTNVCYRMSDQEQLVGVCVNFELANDVHYELTAENWNRFLGEVLLIAPNSNYVDPFREFLNTSIPQVDFGTVLDNKHIEYKKIAYFDFED